MNYKLNSKTINPDEYINSLIDYIENINNFNKIGKFLFVNKDMEFRQLIYKMHRIFYAIKDNEIFILVISHTSRDTKTIFNYLKKYF